MRRRLITWAALLVAGLLGTNLLFPTVATPTGSALRSDSTEEPYQFLIEAGIVDEEVKFVVIPELTVFGQETDGYVNMFEEEDIVYVRPASDTKFTRNPSWYRSVVLHEYAHILQKRLVEERFSGNLGKLAGFIELNEILSEEAPNLNDSAAALDDVRFLGLETNADCILGFYTYYPTYGYVNPKSKCNVFNRGRSLAVISGEYPTLAAALTFEEEASILAVEAAAENFK